MITMVGLYKGLLMTYTTDFAEIYQRGAEEVYRILGATPTELLRANRVIDYLATAALCPERAPERAYS